MQTNAKILRLLPCGIEVEGRHLTQEVDLTSLWQQTQAFAGKINANLTAWLKSRRTREFIEATAKLLDTTPDKIVHVKGRGQSAHTWAHINVAIKAMMYLSPEVEAQVVHEFVQGRIFRWRNVGGDNFVDLNATLALNAEEILGKPAHRGHYITLAKILKQRCEVDDWVTASAEAHAKRATLEDRLSTMLRAGVVRDWDHLKELAEKV